MQQEPTGRVSLLLSDFRGSIVMIEHDELHGLWVAASGSIDVWWHTQENDAMMLTLAHCRCRTAGLVITGFVC